MDHARTHSYSTVIYGILNFFECKIIATSQMQVRRKYILMSRLVAPNRRVWHRQEQHILLGEHSKYLEHMCAHAAYFHRVNTWEDVLTSYAC